MSISIDQVKKIAGLARLSLDDSEAEALAEDLSRILDFADSISELDTANVPPTSHVVPIADVLRDDKPFPSTERAKALSAAPRADDECFVAPKIV